MAIETREFDYEKAYLMETKGKVMTEIDIKTKADDELEKKISGLKKASKGKYNEDLETAQKLYDITHKNLLNYKETLNLPYFARIDFREKRKEQEQLYIGKFGIIESETGDPLIIDWRAPVADLYYSGTQGEVTYETPNGWIDGELYLKRKFLIKEGELSDAFDEGINEIILKTTEENSLVDEFLKINLEESISSKLKDVVATIQKEQNDVIRASISGPLIIQGSAGSGKTTVALHRLAYILYKYRKTMEGSDVLVIAPNKLFLDYISEVLPSLGVDQVKQRTLEEITQEITKVKGKIITKDHKLIQILDSDDDSEKKMLINSSKFKGSLLFKRIIDRYVRYIEKKDAENITDIRFEDFVLFKESFIKKLYIEDMRNLSLDKRKEEILKFLKKRKNQSIKEVYEKLEMFYDLKVLKIKREVEDEVQRRAELTSLYDERDSKRDRLIKGYNKTLDEYFNSWKHDDIKKLYRELLFDEEIFKEVAEDSIPQELYNHIKEDTLKNSEKDLVDADDLIAMAYLKLKIYGIDKKLIHKHVVIDEAQDYSYFAYEVIKEFSSGNSYTIVGDLGQGIYYYKGIEDWQDLISKVFSYNSSYISLKQSYRSTVEIIDFANRVLKKQNLSIEPSMPVLRHGEYPTVIKYEDNKDFGSKIDEIVEKMQKENKKSIAIICKTEAQCKKLKDILKKSSSHTWDLVKDTDNTFNIDKLIIPANMTKGLEFDVSIIYDLDEQNYKVNKLDSKLLYVALTRALHYEYVFYKDDLSKLVEE